MSCVMSFFDPLGLLSVFTFYGKLLIQDLWRSGCEWDQQIGDEEAEKWYQWIRRLPEVEEVRIPRYYFCGGRSLDYASLQLHTFVDASQDAYGAATYIRIETDEGPICSLFVAFRIGEIHSLTKIAEWRWVPTKCNAADALTKWEKAHSMHSDAAWFRGPGFLYQPEDCWPKQDSIAPNVAEEVRACVQFHDIAITMSIVDLQRFSKWRIEAVPTTEAVKKAVKKTVRSTTVPLKREEYQKAEAYLWRSAQADCFGDEIRTIKKNRQLPLQQQQQLEKSSSLYNLSPFLDTEDVLRMEGRAAQGSSLPFELRFPIILPKQHLVTDKLLEYYHHRVAHGNVESAVNEIRQRFSIQNLRAELKRIGKSCMWCKVKKCRARTPRMAPLPESRVTPGLPPFSHTGVDFCGPVTVTVGRRSEKRYICLFTCMTTRAVHLEVAHSLTTQACLMAIRRFVCRRGKPLEFYSDNGTNFQAASKAIVKQIGEKCEDEFTDSRTRWNFNPPSAPHMGGVWERLVRSLKAALTVLNDGRTITDEVLLTTIAEAEDLINSRPLTYVGLEPGTEEALTPNHFVRGVGTIGEEHPVPPTSEAEALRDRYKRSQRLADKLWARWVFEYLPSINHRAKWHTDVPPIASGDLVYIADDAVRKSWIRGIVLDVYPGADGRIRQAMVQTVKGKFRRPVTKLAVLEVQDGNSGVAEAPPEIRGGSMLAPLPPGIEKP
ncbi:uncharacterized protein LOC134209160 [Armigeres subalbatus]|uniref:uncharacterized protein LOC134209160 n=1 Tax=Armigeres subalbatus TaxID=124917 RepID=UPI002ED1FFCF